MSQLDRQRITRTKRSRNSIPKKQKGGPKPETTASVGGRQIRNSRFKIDPNRETQKMPGFFAPPRTFGGSRAQNDSSRAGEMKKAEHLARPFSFQNPRRRPTLPRSYPRSTIGPGGLNFRVRDGNGCDPSGMVAGKRLRTGARSQKPGVRRKPPSRRGSAPFI